MIRRVDLDAVEVVAGVVPILERRFPGIRHAMAWVRGSVVVLLVTGVGVGALVPLILLFIRAGQDWGTHGLLPAMQSAAAVPTTRG